MKGTNAKIRINGKVEYSWAHLEIRIANVLLEGVRAIDYQTITEIENGYSYGNTPTHREIGNISYEGSLTVLSSSLNDLMQSAKGLGYDYDYICGLPPFSIVIIYQPINGGEGLPVKVVLEECQFKNFGQGLAQGDMNIETQLDLAIGFIKY